jgi:hypothetical protein
MKLTKPMPKRLCEISRNFCSSAFCINNNYCGKVHQGTDLKELTADDIAAAKYVNDRIILEMAEV